ncbi:enoyl-CoA hydratase-related protein [Micromonospora sp. ATA51]|uniref:enoyl-CoA hydratase-related protein n=1 Tax=Micromonospora sp. ATA51 TaxID=2806098 RepID=UPI001A5D0546|nr:enoyl-CoA hydratase-related protein [Micromonospora sp. ATA51]MBM0225200.1 enoyl-CoA hydratase/isomerase family protein [Micromonospora sp. ATA51]
MPSSPGSRSEVLVEKQGPALAVTFNRPRQRNAMTWAMYDGLYQACERADADDDVRVLVLRGAGEDAFVAGTDIRQFADFTGGADGVEYERKITRVLDRLEDVNVPTVAAIRGYCVGAGLAIAAVCDLRLATPDARFGIPIARTLGNCLSMPTYALLLHHLGPAAPWICCSTRRSTPVGRRTRRASWPSPRRISTRPSSRPSTAWPGMPR